MRAWVLSVLLTAATALAATPPRPYLVRDIDPSGVGIGSEPTGFERLGSRAIFFTNTGELWSSDGEPGGTVRLSGETFSPSALAVGKSLAYVLADDPHGRQVWATDGTVGGTRRLTVEPLGFDERPRRNSRLVLPGGDRIFWSAEGAEHGSELWTSDGTVEGTREVADLARGNAGSEPHEMTYFRGRVYFVADDGSGFSLWATDGTLDGTRLIRDPEPSIRQTDGPRLLTVVGTRLFFFVRNADGWTLWQSDGRPGGTSRVAPVGRGTISLGVSDAIGRGGRLFFLARTGESRQLWTSDGTAAGTRRLTRFSTASSTAEERFPPQPEGGDRLLFVATDEGHGREPWTSEGTAAGTSRLRDVCPGPCDGWTDGNDPSDASGSSDGGSDRVSAFRGRVLFPGTTPARGTELWSTDGTSAGTRLLFDACRGACSGSPDPIAAAAGKLYFGAFGGSRDQIWRTDGTSAGTFRVSDFEVASGAGARYEGAGAGTLFLFGGQDAVIGRELWRTDGSRPGTELVADLVANRPGSSSPQEIHRAGSRVIFLADGHEPGGGGVGLWSSDGSEEGTGQIVEPTGPGSPFLLSSASAGVHLTYFYRVEGGVYGIWRSDGTVAGTFEITPPGVRVETSQAVQVFGDLGYFTAEDSDHGEELWRTDGTPEGTFLVADVDPGPPGSQPDRFASFVGHLVFEARVAGDLVLYVSDGTEEGTRPLAEAFPFLDPLAGARLLDAESEGVALFQKSDPTGHAEIWATDGTEPGTRRLLAGLTYLSDFSASDGSFLFRAGASFETQAIYRSDGTSAGTRAIATDLFLRSDLVKLQTVGGRYLFSAARLDDPSHPALYASDGTAEGTRPLIETEAAVDAPRSAAPFGNRILIAGGSRLWSSDGTPEGTSVVLETGSAARAPLPVVAGGRAFFAWTTPETGTELWAVGSPP